MTTSHSESRPKRDLVMVLKSLMEVLPEERQSTVGWLLNKLQSGYVAPEATWTIAQEVIGPMLRRAEVDGEPWFTAALELWCGDNAIGFSGANS